MTSSLARRALRWTGATAAVAAPAAAGAAWAAARELTSTPPPRVRQPTLRARFVDDHLVELTGDRAHDPGTWGLRLDHGFVQVLDVRAAAADRAVRPFHLLEGEVDLPELREDRRVAQRRSDEDRRGATDPLRLLGRRRRLRDRRREQIDPPWPVDATITPYAWPDDPQVLAQHLGVELRLDGVRSSGHTLPTWLLLPPEPRDTWVVAVHGRSSSRTELFRLAEIALRTGLPVLIASYRTDAWTAAPPPVTTLGMTEWRDVEANVAAALAGGAKQVVLAGCSLGGGLVAQVVRRSRLAPWIAGIVLDSPALAWHRILQHLAVTNRLPTLLVPAVMTAARIRARIDWDALDHLTAADEFAQPVLVLHGREDDVVPVWTSEAFAAARPDLVTLEVFPDADHVTGWNHAPIRYSRAVRRFLSRVAATT